MPEHLQSKLKSPVTMVMLDGQIDSDGRMTQFFPSLSLSRSSG